MYWLLFCCDAVATSCNSRRQAAATRAVAADLHTGNQNMELALALDLPFETVEKIGLGLQDFPASQACHVQTIALRSAFVKMLLRLELNCIPCFAQAGPLESFQASSPRRSH